MTTSEEPKHDDDHDLKIRLARLCGMPVHEEIDGNHNPKECPQVRFDSDGEPVFFETSLAGGVVPWNPLEDERQAFRYVVAAMGRMGISVTAWSDKNAEGEIRYGALAVDDGRCGKIVSAGPWSDSVARCLCLAALEAWEKLEERDGATAG